jgi:hypothetical protein
MRQLVQNFCLIAVEEGPGDSKATEGNGNEDPPFIGVSFMKERFF